MWSLKNSLLFLSNHYHRILFTDFYCQQSTTARTRKSLCTCTYESAREKTTLSMIVLHSKEWSNWNDKCHLRERVNKYEMHDNNDMMTGVSSRTVTKKQFISSCPVWRSFIFICMDKSVLFPVCEDNMACLLQPDKSGRDFRWHLLPPYGYLRGHQLCLLNEQHSNMSSTRPLPLPLHRKLNMVVKTIVIVITLLWHSSCILLV